MEIPVVWQQAIVIVLIVVLGFCLIVGVITVMRWPWYRGHVLPGGVEQMIYQLGPLTSRQLEVIWFRLLEVVDIHGHASWADVQTAVAFAREVRPVEFQAPGGTARPADR